MTTLLQRSGVPLQRRQLQSEMSRFIARPVSAQRQVIGPVLGASACIQQEEARSSGLRAPLQRQVAELNAALPSGALKAALQRQTTASLPVPVRPQTAGEWVTVMRHRAEQVEGQRLTTKQAVEFTALQRQVATVLAHSACQESPAAFAGHAVTLQRHPLSASVARTALGLLPPLQRVGLQRAVDEAVHQDSVQRAQDTQALALDRIQRQLAELNTEAAQPVLQRIQARRGNGNPLPAAIQRHLEQGLNHDLGRVRIHDDAEADKLAKAVNAVAFTTGTDIFFRSGRFNPNTQTGLELLAHEVTHTVQQSQGRVGQGIDPDAALEHEARRMGAKLSRGLLSVSAHTRPRPATASLPRSASLQRLQAPASGKPSPASDPLLTQLNDALGLSLKETKDVYPILKKDAKKRMRFFGQFYPGLPAASPLGKLLGSSKDPVLRAYIESYRLKAAKQTWNVFPAAVKKLFESMAFDERSNAINFFGGNASVLNHRYGGQALVQGTPTQVEVRKEVRFQKIGQFPKDLSYTKAKNAFLAKSMAIWSNKHKLSIVDLKNKKDNQTLPIKVQFVENQRSSEVVNIYGAALGRSNANGSTLKIYLHNEDGSRETQFALVAAHEVGHFMFGAMDEYKDVIDPKTKKVIGSKSTTNDNSIMAVFYNFPAAAQSHSRHYAELLVNFQKMYPGKKVTVQ
ncbi:DUF4157 domain-containing protein [Deinococcus hohokamensis]|uniref:DUF4157 domain-containing protein n=1 Tax=Deinococcus hohokamensis TaxID=309883 RepID=A0ABV9IDF9_9DEIO